MSVEVENQELSEAERTSIGVLTESIGSFASESVIMKGGDK